MKPLETLPAGVEELLKREVLRARDLAPNLLLPAVGVAQVLLRHLTIDEIHEEIRLEVAGGPTHRVAHALLHVLRFRDFVERGEITWEALERRFREMIEYEVTN